MGAIERVSSVSCSSSPRKERKKPSSHKVVRKANSFSSPSPSTKEKEKNQRVSSQKDIHEVPKGGKKLIQRSSSSLSSSLSCSLKKDKPVFSKGRKDETKKNPSSSSSSSSSSFKSRIRELGPICKRRKDSLSEVPVKAQVEEDDVDVCLDKQIKGELGKDDDQNDCLWLSSGNMSPQEFGLFMSSLDPSLDEWVISFVPPDVGPTNVGPTRGGNEEEQVIESGSPSSFWNTDRTGVWVSLINLNGEDSRWISEMDCSEEMESNFPSPNYEINLDDSYSSDMGFTSSARSTQETSHSEWSSELLSDSMDWENDDPEDPIFWPFGMDVNWDDQGWEPFSISPRKGVSKINFESIKDGSKSIRVRIHARKSTSKEALRKRILFVSGLSAAKMIEFKKARRGRKRGGRLKRRSAVPTILENVLEEGKSPRETPTKEAAEKADQLSSDIVSECTDNNNWDEDMLVEDTDDDGPLFWPSDQNCAWDSTWDSFNVSPRKGSPRGGFSVSSSVRLRFRPKKKTLKTSDLCASKSFKFKSKALKSGITSGGKSSRDIMVILPSNKAAEFKHGSSNRKRVRAMPLRSVTEIMRLVSVMGKKSDDDADLASENLTIETVMGLDEFDGHEGVEPEFEGEKFSLEECVGE